tara:strand:+ start:279 stop:545 length:267 start_codon:yes stop_codon:yes gene_type:complete
MEDEGADEFHQWMGIDQSDLVLGDVPREPLDDAELLHRPTLCRAFPRRPPEHPSPNDVERITNALCDSGQGQAVRTLVGVECDILNGC